MAVKNKLLRVAVVGTGYFGQYHIAAWQRMPEIDVVAICSSDALQAESTQARFQIPKHFNNLGTMLDAIDVDLIDIVTPPASHVSLVSECLNAGTAVICQKPFCESLEQAEQLVKLIREYDGFVAIHENFRFQPWYQHIKSIIDSGSLGDLYEIRFNLRPGDGQGPEAYLQRQPYFQQQKRFAIQETGIHFIDVFRFLFGEVSGLFAKLSKLNPVIAGEDAGIVVLQFQNGARGILNINRLSDHCATDLRRTMGELSVEGSQGTVHLNGDGQITFRAHGDVELKQHDFAWQDIDFGGDCVYTTNRHIVDHLLYQKPVHNLAADYLINRRIEEKVYASSAAGQWLEM